VLRRILLFLLATGVVCPAPGAADFFNWESPHVHPLDLTPDGATLVAVNTADARLEIFAPSALGLPHHGSIPVGLDPVSVRARTATEVWVVNAVSDTISIVDLSERAVVRTLAVCDEPADVVFAGSPQRAFVSCSSTDRLLVYDAAAPVSPVAEVAIDAEEPRALAVSPDGTRVYAAIFESGNGTTILSGGRIFIDFFPSGSTPPNVVNDADGPYGGRNPPPNSQGAFEPPIRPEYLPSGDQAAPRVGLIVRKSPAGTWLDDVGTDWTPWVSGAQAGDSGRVAGWTLVDRDVAIVDAASLDVTYAHGLMNLVMAIGVRPSDGGVTVVGTESLNEVRFEPNLKGRFVRVEMARFAPELPALAEVVDLNAGHLDYTDVQIAAQSDPGSASQALRDRSVGDPRAIVWRPDGLRGYVAGMGSGNVVVVDPSGERLSPLGAPGASTIEVGEGPTGLVLDPALGRLYVLERFGAAVSWIDLATEQLAGRRPFHDATPPAIRSGRRFLYDTRATSGLGQVSCASCHVDARMDRLAWDLGDPGGDVVELDGAVQNLGMGGFFFHPFLNFGDYHPMKGPMTTQTLVDIIGKEPFHWRGDRVGIEQFNAAFETLLGDDTQLTAQQMAEFKAYLATLRFPPNPFRDLDNSLRDSLPLPGFEATGKFALAAGTPLPPGDPQHGLELYRPPTDMLQGHACATCHTLPTGASAAVALSGGQFLPLPLGPNGENHLSLVQLDRRSNRALKVPQLRSVGDKVGMRMSHVESRAGFGFTQDGSIPTLEMFLNSFETQSDQEVADLIAFLLSLPGSDLPGGSSDPANGEPPGPPSRDTHAAVGVQVTFDALNVAEPGLVTRLSQLVSLADAGDVDLVAQGRVAGLARGYRYAGSGVMQSDRAAETTPVEALRTGVAVGGEVTFTAVPAGSGTRLGVDRDDDGSFDRDELDACGDPADPASAPVVGCIFADGLESGDTWRWSVAAPG